MKQRTYIAIDLKSFYASVECRERGLDSLDTNLVVADESGMGNTNERLAPSCKGAKLLDGKVFKHNVGHQELAAWVDGLKL